MKIRNLVAAISLTFAGILLSANSAKADAASVCFMEGDLTIKSAHILVGGSVGTGKGTIHCKYLDGEEYFIPVLIKTKSIGFGIGASKTEAKLVSGGVQLMTDGYALLGKYAMVKGGAQIIDLGADIGVSLTAKRNALALPLELKLKKGPGVELAVNIGQVEIMFDSSAI